MNRPEISQQYRVVVWGKSWSPGCRAVPSQEGRVSRSKTQDVFEKGRGESGIKRLEALIGGGELRKLGPVS